MSRVIEILINSKGETTVTTRASPALPAAMPASSSSKPSVSGPVSS